MVTYRAVRADEADRLTKFAEQTFRETYESTNQASDMDAYSAEHFTVEQQLAEIKTNRVIVAETGDQWVGYYVLIEAAAPVPLPEPTIELSRLYLAKDHIGTRLGHYLMQHALTNARYAGFKTIWLGVWENNPRAIAFYKKWIFKEVGAKIFLLGKDPQRDLIFAHSL